MKAHEIDNYEYVVNNNLGLVYKIVSRFYVTPFERDDLIQAGLMGLLRAARKFDISKGYQFSTYATPFILGEIKKELNKRNLISVNQYFKKIAKQIQATNGSVKMLALLCKTSVENVILATSYQHQVTLVDPIDLEQYHSEPSVSDKYYTHFNNLNSIDREIFRLRFFYQWTQGEIAKKLNLHQSNVSRRLRKIASLILENK